MDQPGFPKEGEETLEEDAKKRSQEYAIGVAKRAARQMIASPKRHISKNDDGGARRRRLFVSRFRPKICNASGPSTPD